MTTITMERADTGEHISAYQVRARIDELDGAATEAPVQIEPWVPRDPHARERCTCGKYHQSALIAPASDVLYAEGSTVAAELVRGVDHAPGWPTWLGTVHHADATWTQAVTDLRTWADTYAARPVEHTSAERVEISDEYAEKRLAAELQYRGLTSGTSVYEHRPLDPDVLDAEHKARQAQAGPPHRQDWTDHERQDEQETEQPPADRSDVEALARRDKERRQREQRALTTGEQPAQAEPEPERRGRLRRMWDAIRTWDGSGA